MHSTLHARSSGYWHGIAHFFGKDDEELETWAIESGQSRTLHSVRRAGSKPADSRSRSIAESPG